MAKFKYYVTDLFSGEITGVVDNETAKELSLCEDFFVVDVETGQWLMPDGTKAEVKPYGET